MLNFGDLLVIAVLAGVVTLIVRSMWKNRRAGKGCAGCSGCSGNCSSCCGR